ncbi:unnamed protein product [Withania somnifera]
MERKPELNAGETSLPLMESNEAFINGMYDGMSYQSLLSLSLDNNSYYGELKPFSSFLTPLVNDMLYTTANSSQIQQSFPHPDADQKLKFAKLEPPFNYFSNVTSNGFEYYSLPDLRCLEQPNYLDFHYGKSSSIEPVSHVMSSLSKSRKQAYASSATRMRRQKLSEKTRCLEKLLPWDKKMDTATMLEEAHKYVKFLQAQISVLQNMPPLGGGGGASSSSSTDQDKNAISVFGTLGRLNRQQLLQVVLNSPVAQTYLYSKGCCVYSAEQLVQYRKIAQRNALYRQTLFFSGMLS